MTSQGFQERILTACYQFMDENNSRYKDKRDEQFYKQFNKFLTERSLDSMLRRGCQSDFKHQWQSSHQNKERNIHELLQGDRLQQISVNRLIEEMKTVDTEQSYDFSECTNDVIKISSSLHDFLLSETETHLRKTLDEPRFYQNRKSVLNAFLPASKKEKGLLTRIAENDPSLAQVDHERIEDGRGEVFIQDLSGDFYPNGVFYEDKSSDARFFVSKVVKYIEESSPMSYLHFQPTRDHLEVQKVANDIREYLRRNSDRMTKEGQLKAAVGLSFISTQLKDMLKPCSDLLDIAVEGSFASGREIELDGLMRILAEKQKQQTKDLSDIKGPQGTENVLEKVKKVREFEQTADLISVLTGQDYAAGYTVKPVLKPEWPTAQEYLYSLVRYLLQIARFVKKRDWHKVQDLFFKALTIDQSPQTYSLLLSLVEKSGNHALSLQDKYQRDLATFIFDGFSEILLNNLQALFESERGYLDRVFATKRLASDSTAKNSTENPEHPGYLQKFFYPRLLKTLLRVKMGLGSLDADELCEWQKVIYLEDSGAMREIYAESQVENHADLYKKHSSFMPHLIDFDEELPKIMVSLDTAETKENKEHFDKAVESAREFIHLTSKCKSPTLSTLIREVFKRKMTAKEDSDNKICDKLATQLKSHLFVASDNQRSKIASVVADIVSKDIELEQNQFTMDVIRMLTADSVNILKNIKEVSTEKHKETKLKLPWKKVVKKHQLHGSNGGYNHHNDGQTVVDEFPEDELPQIKEFGLYTDGFVVGFKIEYSNGKVFDRKGGGRHNNYESITMEQGEFITVVHGRFGCWCDQIRIETNHGRKLSGGGNGGCDKSPVYPQRSYFIGMDSHLDDHVTKIDTYYINLDEVPFDHADPLVTLISESDLLSKGLEQKYFGIFSKNVLDEIQTVQEIIGKPILDSSVSHTGLESTNATSASSTATSMINTGGPSNSSRSFGMPSSLVDAVADDDLHLKLIHAGRSEQVDDFIQVLQMLLRESREPVRLQMNLMQENGMRVSRACFAAIVKLSGLTYKLEGVLDNLELQEMDFEADEPAQRLKLMKEAAKELTSETPLLLTEWTNAVKMRKWLQDQCRAAKIDVENVSDKNRLEAIIEQVVKKAEFLVKLEKSPVFQSMNPKEQIFELSYKIPSYARDYVKDKDELEETPEEKANLWREHYKNWKTDLKNQGTIRNQQQQHSKIRSIGTASIIVCMQHKEITAELLTSIVEANTLNACYRLAGLQLLEFTLQMICRTQKDEKPNLSTMMAVRSVAAALSKGLRKEKSLFQQNVKTSYHYLDQVKSCGSNIEVLIRQAFFRLIKQISEYFNFADQGNILELLSCLDWNFKARDFEQLHDLKVFKLLHQGISKQIQTAGGEVQQQNIILESWKMKPDSTLTKELQIISSNLYMSIVSRLAEPEARKIIFDKSDERATGVSSLQKASSIVNVNAAQALLAEEFNIMFREFHEFVLVSSKLSNYISFETISDFFNTGESSQRLLGQMPTIINDVMQKILQNAPHDRSKLEESKSSAAQASPDDIKVVIPDESEEQKAPQKKRKVYDLCQYTQEQIDVLELIDEGTELTPAQREIHQQIQQIEEESMMGGMFNEADEEEGQQIVQEVFIKELARDDPSIPTLRQKIVQKYREFIEAKSLARYINMVEIFVKVATKAPYPLEMLQNVANPYHIKTLLRMLFQVSPSCKLQILSIFATLLRIQVPMSIFDEGVTDLQFKFRTETQVEFQSSFTKLLFQAALQIQSNTWDSSFSEEFRSGMYDVYVNLTRTVALCLKISNQESSAKWCADLSKACLQIGKQELSSEHQVTTVLQVLQATCTMPVSGDCVIFANELANQNEPEQSEYICNSKSSRKKVFESIKYAKGCIIVPNFVPDTEIPLVLSTDALESLIRLLADSQSELQTGSISRTLEIVYIIKLLILQHKENGGQGLQDISNDVRNMLVRALFAIQSYRDKDAKDDEGTYITSLQEFGIAVQLRDQIETILPSGVDPFDKCEDPPADQSPASAGLKLLPQKSIKSKGKKHSAASKYATYQVLSKAKSKSATKDPGSAISKNQKLINSMFSEFCATDKEVAEMVADMVDICTYSGCTLLDLLYAVNEVLTDEKRHFSTDSIIDMFNEQLEGLAENEDVDKDAQLEKQFVEQVTKKLEKIAQVHKPETFKNDVLLKLNLEQAIEEVEARTHGKSNLMRARAEDRLFSNKDVYKSFTEKFNGLCQDGFNKMYEQNVMQSRQGSQWPLNKFPLPKNPLQNDQIILKSAVILAKRFAEILLFKVFDPTITAESDSGAVEEETKDIAEVIAQGQDQLSPLVTNFYFTMFGQVAEGLTGYAKSIEIMNKSNGVECAWEVSFTENFKIESNLSSDFKSLRKLDDYVFTKSVLQIKSASTMAQQALNLLSTKIVRKDSKEASPQRRRFISYLFKTVITALIDDFSQRVDAKSVTYQSNLVNAISNAQPYLASSSELVERVRIVTCSILQSRSTHLIGTFAPDMLNLTLFAVVYDGSTLSSKRLLIEEAYQIVDAFDSSEADLKTYVEMGSWERIFQCRVLRQLLDAISMKEPDQSLEAIGNKQSLLNVLLLELHSKIDNIDKKVEGMTGVQRALQTNEFSKDAQALFNHYKTQVTKKLAFGDIQLNLLSNYIASEQFEDKFKQEFIVPAIGEPIRLDLGHIDGAKVKFEIEAQNSQEKEKISSTQFKVKYSLEGSEKEDTDFKLYLDSNEDEHEIESRFARVTCVANMQKTNVVATAGRDEKFRRDYGMIKYILSSEDKQTTYFVTNCAIFMEGKHGTKEITPLQDLFRVKDNRITEVKHFGSEQIFTLETGVRFSTDKPRQQELVPDKINGVKVMREVIHEQIRAFITSENKLHYQGLFDKLQSEEREVQIEQLSQLDHENRVNHYQDGDKIVDLHIGGTGAKKYAILSVNRNGNKLLYSKRFSSQVLRGSGRPEGDEEKFYLMANQNAQTSFERLWLFENVAFAVGASGHLWILGGSLAAENQDIFPKEFGCELFEGPVKTKFIPAVMRFLQLEDSVRLEIRDLNYQEECMLVKIQKTAADGTKGDVYLSLTIREGKYELGQVDRDTFVVEKKLWQLKDSDEQMNDDEQPEAQAVLKLTVRPRIRDVYNVSMAQLANECAQNLDWVDQLEKLAKLGKNEDLIFKVYRAINNWVRSKLENRLPNDEDFENMIKQASSKFESQDYNPLKCWNEVDTEQDVNMLVRAFAKINKEINFWKQNMLSSVRKLVLNDPLLNPSLLQERLDQDSAASSVGLSFKLCQLNNYLLTRIQDEQFEKDPKEPQCSESRIEIDFFRFKASQYATDGKVDRGDGDTLFTQLFQGMEKQQKDRYKTWWRREGGDNRVFRANFKGESSIDAGGPYRETMENISRELCSSVLPVLIPTDNQLQEHGDMRECYVLNHQARTESELKQIHHFGLIIGFAIRSMQTWNIALHPIIWKEIVGAPLDSDVDLKTSEKFMHQFFDNMRQQAQQSASEEEFSARIENQCFTIDVGLGETEIIPGGAQIPVTRANLEHYIEKASMSILKKASLQMEHFLSGVYFIVRKSACQSLSWRNAEIRAMGEPIIDMNILKQYTNNEHSLPANTMKWFWEVLNEMEEEDKQKYLKFVNGRAKLPSNPAEGRRHKITNGRGGDKALPQAHTCFFQIDLPVYTSKEILREKVLIAIRLCGEIDTD